MRKVLLVVLAVVLAMSLWACDNSREPATVPGTSGEIPGTSGEGSVQSTTMPTDASQPTAQLDEKKVYSGKQGSLDIELILEEDRVTYISKSKYFCLEKYLKTILKTSLNRTL